MARKTWNMCHIEDLVQSYEKLLSAILAPTITPAFGESGYYFASAGTFSWSAIMAVIVSQLQGRRVTAEDLSQASTAELNHMDRFLQESEKGVLYDFKGESVQSLRLAEVSPLADRPACSTAAICCPIVP